MIDDKFSTAAFAALGLDTKAARERADLLANEVYDEIYEVYEVMASGIISAGIMRANSITMSSPAADLPRKVSESHDPI